MEIQEFYHEFMQEIYAKAEGVSNFKKTVFLEHLCNQFIEDGLIEDYVYIGYKKESLGIYLDAYEINEELSLLNLFVSDYKESSELQTLTPSEARKFFKRAEKFFERAMKKNFIEDIEESTPAFQLLYELKNKFKPQNIKIYILTNSKLSSRLNEFENKNQDGIKFSYDIWDISRLFRIKSSGKEKEDTVIKFDEGLPCLPAFTGNSKYQSYLFVLSGKRLSELYEEYGERLLEQNVRTFLQFRGKVNKGMRRTILKEPDMFFAFNNGICATADKVETENNNHTLKSIYNLQIVNGGQTTASIFNALKKDKADLSQIYIQTKLSIIYGEKVDEVIPRISEYSNTQNKVNAADFFSNHPFHLRMQEHSRAIWAPSKEGSIKNSLWFYERARGQYANQQVNLTSAQKREFLSKYPKNQMFTKTDFAKVENSFNLKPDIVSKGAQKNFGLFASDIGKIWDKDSTIFNALFFKNHIAKRIIFIFLDKNIMRQEWYGGYKANIVTYSIAKLVSMVSRHDKKIDFEKIWKNQKLSNAFEIQLLAIADKINERIHDTPPTITNISEWCKKASLWDEIRENLIIELNQNIHNDLIDKKEAERQEIGARRGQRVDDGINAEIYVVKKGADYWKKISLLGIENKLLTDKEISILTIACKIPHKIPTDNQSKIIIEIEKKIKEEGYI